MGPLAAMPVFPRCIAIHANEHLATSDRGVIMTREMLRAAVEAVARGEDPAGIVRDPERDLVQTRAGNLIVTPAAAGGER
jgi:hypothetical protein